MFSKPPLPNRTPSTASHTNLAPTSSRDGSSTSLLSRVLTSSSSHHDSLPSLQSLNITSPSTLSIPLGLELPTLDSSTWHLSTLAALKARQAEVASHPPPPITQVLNSSQPAKRKLQPPSQPTSSSSPRPTDPLDTDAAARSLTGAPSETTEAQWMRQWIGGRCTNGMPVPRKPVKGTIFQRIMNKPRTFPSAGGYISRQGAPDKRLLEGLTDAEREKIRHNELVERLFVDIYASGEDGALASELCDVGKEDLKDLGEMGFDVKADNYLLDGRTRYYVVLVSGAAPGVRREEWSLREGDMGEKGRGWWLVDDDTRGGLYLAREEGDVWGALERQRVSVGGDWVSLGGKRDEKERKMKRKAKVEQRRKDEEENRDFLQADEPYSLKLDGFMTIAEEESEEAEESSLEIEKEELEAEVEEEQPAKEEGPSLGDIVEELRTTDKKH